MISSRLIAVVVSIPFGILSHASADDPLKSSADQRLGFAQRAAAGYRFRVARPKSPEVKLEPKPLLRWNNQVVREDDGMLFLWTEGDHGRPVAAAQFFLVDTQWHHEFQSLSPFGFEARSQRAEGGDWTWQPTSAGLSFVAADNIDSPAATASQRLRQMKSIAERFTAAVDPEGKFESPEELRLLTTPIYRYSAPDQGVVDGAVFVLAQGTNPEVMILIESDDAGATWKYAFARMSCFHLRVRQNDQIVWQRNRAPVPTPSAASPYFFRLNAELDRSDEVEVPPAAANGK